MEAPSSPEAEGTFFNFFYSFSSFFFFLLQTLAPLQQRIWGPGVVASGARLVWRKPGELVIQRKI